MCAKRQEWLKQGIDDISVATVKGLWGSNFEVVPRVSPSWRQGKGKSWQASDRAIRDQWELLQSAAFQTTVKNLSLIDFTAFNCLEKNHGDTGLVAFGDLPCSLAI